MKKKPVNKTHPKKSNSFFLGLKFSKDDFSKENLIEGGIMRPALLMIAFATFIGAMFLLLIGNLKWGGSFIIFSFILNLYAIYISLIDKPSAFRTLNLGFKLLLFLSEVMAFNWVLMNILA